ncbi:hypothetical protein [Phosphitispora fastidiosa]|uniref:hypothetical protein n=1 Tax=Phosphitispora fastidiosa TaxID=2837202 RepID=UPI001E327384|nr:hypothetical protein [Phosphitispora fastidiosa]MBU7005774.1 hypothetical protein [Phosphitispora fastidiosa]
MPGIELIPTCPPSPQRVSLWVFVYSQLYLIPAWVGQQCIGHIPRSLAAIPAVGNRAVGVGHNREMPEKTG